MGERGERYKREERKREIDIDIDTDIDIDIDSEERLFSKNSNRQP